MKSAGYVWKNAAGWCALDWTERGLARFRFFFKSCVRAGSALPAAWALVHELDSAPSWVAETVVELDKYFSGVRVDGFGAPLDFSGATGFQKKVWNAARRIPYAETRSYVQVARAIRAPRAVRAVGNALGANPMPVIVPCHRVLKSDGTLGGFSIGTEIKEALLFLEQGETVDFAGAGSL